VVWLDKDNQVLSVRKKVYKNRKDYNVIHTTREEWSLEVSYVPNLSFVFGFTRSPNSILAGS
jgi:hypothetical protein